MTMSRSRSRSPPRARSASPRRSPFASPVQLTSPHSAADEGEDYDGEEYEGDDGDFDDGDLTHSEKVRLYIADSPSPTGSPIEEDQSLLNADELRSKLEAVNRQRGAEYVVTTDIKDVLRVEHERAETLADRLSAREAEAAEVSRIKNELATVKNELATVNAKVAALQAELAASREREAKKNEDLAVVQSKLESLGLSHETPTSLPAASESGSPPKICGNYLQPRSKCRAGCTRVHVEDEVRV